MNVSTVEDPVEYNLEYCNQVQVNEKTGMTFSAALRSLLRQDPDIIMIGEIRDNETARIAVQAALTGHLVLSTLHTNDAPSSVSRLVNIGIEPYLIAASLNGLLPSGLSVESAPTARKTPRLRIIFANTWTGPRSTRRRYGRVKAVKNAATAGMPEEPVFTKC